MFKHGTKGSYFGYSVSEHQAVENGVTIENVLLVGAPRAQTSQPGTNRSGAVYRCPLSTRYSDCSQLNIETEKTEPDRDVLKDDQWLGVTVQSQGPGGFILVSGSNVLTCAHSLGHCTEYELIPLSRGNRYASNTLRTVLK